MTFAFKTIHNLTVMKKIVLLLIAFTVFSSHDMYLKLDTYFLQPNTTASIQLFNGTFENSDNTIARNRMLDVSLVGNGNRSSVDTAQWSEVDNTTILNFKTGAAGTWVAGVSTRARTIEMAAADFNDYLEHDGVLDMLDWRKGHNALDEDAVEKYSKHVKTIFQVGEQLTDDWQTKLGYPIEFIPLSNPYDLHPGHSMQVQLFWQGKPLANQLVYIGSKEREHEHKHNDEHTDEANHHHDHEASADHDHDHEEANEAAADHHHDLTQVRTDADGKLTLDVEHKGIWYLRTIYLIESEGEGLTHESNWATLTFEVGEGHSHEHEHGAHSHDEEAALGIPSYVYWLGSAVLVIGLFFAFNSRTK